MLGALGVVFGDIGTSPLHAIQTAFTIDDGGEPVLPAPGALVADPDGGPGFADDPDVPDALRLAQAQGLECDLDLDGPGPAYFVSRIALTAGDARGLRRWWKKLFVLLVRNGASPVQYFELPIDRTVTVGSTIEA